MPHKFLVVNVHSAQNAGDLALLQMTVAELRNHFPDAYFIISSNFPDEPAVKAVGNQVVASPWRLAGGGTDRKPRYLLLNLAYGWLLAISRKFCFEGNQESGWNRLFKAYQESDIVVAVSGNQFFSSGRFGWPLFAISMSVRLAKMFNKPVYIMPQSIGPFRYGWEYYLLWWSYSYARLIFLRDKQSLKVSKDAKLPTERVLFAPDPAFALRPAEKSAALMILKQYGYQPGMHAIGVTVIASMPSYLNQSIMAGYYKTVAQSLSALAEKYTCHLFFFNQVTGPSSHEDDRITTEAVINQLSAAKAQIHVVSEILNPEELKACYGCMDIFLASRLHSGIFSMGIGVPTVFIGYLSKTRGILETLDLQQNMYELGDFSPKELFLLLERTWLDREHQKEKLNNKMADIVIEVHQIAPMIKEDYGRRYG